MLTVIDNLLNRITMYRLVLYYLIALLVIAGFESLFGLLHYTFISILFSTLFITAVCYITNKVFAYFFEAPTNVESTYITALILALIIQPSTSFENLPFLFWAGVLSMASKYIFAIKRKHLFNPAALAVFLTGIGFGATANWWIGTTPMIPFVIIGGYLVIRKIKREDLFLSFFLASVVMVALLAVVRGGNALDSVQKAIFHSSLFFLGFVMLTEPLTTPPTRDKRVLYGTLVGALFPPQIHLGSIYSTPEIALLIGNIASYLLSPKEKLLLRLKEKIRISPDMMDFLFTPSQRLSFIPGQYLEWTLSHPKTDRRGNRRYFTIASSPTESTLRLGVKFYPKGSSYKNALLNISGEKMIVASQLAGDFTMKKDPHTKYVFMAGGIGITPFRSMIKYLLDTNQIRDIILLYSNKTQQEIVYTDVFNEAAQKLGIKTVYTLTDTASIDPSWQGRKGRIDEAMITSEVPDFKERLFYLSGPHAMVTGFEKTLLSIGVPKSHIIIDYFPGFV